VNNPAHRAELRSQPWILLGFAAFVAVALVLLALHDTSHDDPRSADMSSVVIASAEVADAIDVRGAAPDASVIDDVATPRAARNALASTLASKQRTEGWSGGVITGRVLGGPGAAEPIAFIDVRATAPRSTFAVPERRTRTDAQGRYELRDLIGAHWEIEASLPAIDRRGAARIELDELERPRAEVDVLVPYERRVEVRLVDARGMPITADALAIDPVYLPLLHVALARACKAPGSILGPADMPLNRIVDKSPEGARCTFDVVIQAAGGECVHALFGDRVIASRALAREDVRVDIVLDAHDVARFLGSCAVHVVDAEHGTPVTSGQVTFQLLGARLTRQPATDGVASILNVPFGSVRVEVVVPGYVTCTLSLEVPLETPLRVELFRPRRLAGRISSEVALAGFKFKPAVWRVSDPSAQLGEPTARLSKWTAGGTFAFEGLLPAIYVVAATPSSVARLSADDVQSGKVSDAAWVDLTLGDNESVELVVTAWGEDR